MPVYISCIAVWMLYAVLKANSKKLKAVDKSKKFTLPAITKAAFVSYTEKLLHFAAITYSVLAVIIFCLNTFAGKTQSFAVANFMFNGLVSAKAFYELFDETWKWISLGLLAAFVLSVIYRLIKLNRKAMLQRVVDDYNNGNWEELPDTEEMKKIREEIIDLEKALTRLNRTDAATMAKAESLEKEKEALREKIKANNNLLQYYDVIRRIESAADERKIRYVKNNFLNNILVFFTSAGMHTTVKKTESITAAAGSVFLVLSLLTVQLAQVTPSTPNAAYSFQNVVVGHDINKLNQEWEERFKTNPPKENTLTAEETSTIAEFSNLIERQLIRSFSPDSINISEQAAFRLASTVARHSVLNSYAVQRQALSDPHAYIANDPFEDLSKTEANYAETSLGKEFEKETVRTKPATRNGAAMKEKFTEAVKKAKPAEKETILSKMRSYMKSFSEPVSANDVLSMAYETAYNETAGEFAKDFFKNITGDDEIVSKIINGTGSKTSKSLFDNSFELKTKTFANSFIVDQKDVSEALAQAKNIKTATNYSSDLHTVYKKASNVSSIIDHINDGTKNAPPTVTYDYLNTSNADKFSANLDNYAAIKSESIAKIYADELANKALQSGKISVDELPDLKQAYETRLEEYFEPQIKESYAASVSKYEDYFPNYLHAEQATPYGKIASELGLTERTIPTKIVGFADESANIFSNAFNFLSLLGNRRIGGVLIGRNPENKDQVVDCKGLNWEIHNDSITLNITNSDSKPITLGNFSKEIAAQAIAYAADGRPVATTMILTADKLPLKILVHPTLVNSPLGCKIINLDRLVDTYISRKENGETFKALELFQYESLLYNYCAYSIIAMRHLVDDSDKYTITDGLDSYKEYVDKGFSAIKALLKNGLVYNDTLLSPMRYKTDYYNQELIDLLVKGLSDGNIQSGEDLANYIESNLSNGYEAGDILITESEVWSGVRERPYKITQDFSAFSSSLASNPFSVLTFIEQVAYKKSLYCTKDISPESDSSPWEFLSLKSSNVINNIIAKNIKEGNNKEILENAVQFALLQRLFRCGFNGELGLHFPVQKTIELMNEAVKDVYYVKTPEWNTSYKFILFSLYNPGFKPVSDALGISNEENVSPCR